MAAIFLVLNELNMGYQWRCTQQSSEKVQRKSEAEFITVTS